MRPQGRAGQEVLVETCPQYLTLTDEVYAKPDFEGAKFVCSPPIRKEADKQALWSGIKGGEVDIISTDHCSFTFEQKELGRGNFSKIPNGLPGIEHRPAVVWASGVAEGRMSAEAFCRLLSTEPAKAFGMYPRKGALDVGSDADVVVWDPEAKATLSAADMNMLAGYSPWEGMALHGLPEGGFPARSALRRKRQGNEAERRRLCKTRQEPEIKKHQGASRKGGPQTIPRAESADPKPAPATSASCAGEPLRARPNGNADGTFTAHP